jgi:thymidylate synthase
MNKLDRDYQALLQDVLENGVVKQDRTSTGTISVFGRQIRHKMEDGFPLLTTKKVFWKGVVVELLWFLQGRTDLRYLLENQVGIWTGDAYKRYQNHFAGHEDVPNVDWFTHEILHNDEFAAKFGDLGPIYGAVWRNWGSRYETNHILNTKKQTKPGIDQIANLIHDLKTNPDSRRLMVNAWNVGELDSMTLPPCHYGFQVYTRPTTREEKIVNPGKYRAISLMWNQRSVDTFLGLPFNIASYGLLLEIIAEAVNMVPDELIGNLGDVHLYSNHVEQAREQISREPYALPQLVINSGNENWPLLEIDEIIQTLDPDITFGLSNYQSHPAIKAPLSN